MLKNITFLSFSLLILASAVMCQNISVTAHRGASGLAPENTAASIRKAIELKCEFAEVDVQETRDSILVLLHDGNLKRTAGADKNIWETDYNELKALDAGSWFSKDFKGEPIPRFDDVIDLVKGKIKLNIELKTNGHEKKLAERDVELVEEKNFVEQCIITSFDFNLIKKVRSLNPRIKVGYIFSRLHEEEDVFTADIDLLSVNQKLVDTGFVKKAKENKKEIHVWTVNDEKAMSGLITLGVNSIITNYPNKLHTILSQEKNK